MISRLLLLVAAVVAIRAIYYFYYYNRGNRWYQIFDDYINKQDDKSFTELQGIQGQVSQLLRLTGQDGIRIPYVEPVGFNYVNTGHIAPDQNLDNLREDVVGTNIRLFQRAIGTCKTRAIQSFNPIFWLESIAYLPTKLLAFLGVKGDNLLAKILQVIWWLFTAAVAVIEVVFNKDFIAWLEQVF